ncbi:hypothetical protein [Parendozoicomonas sp. Alg238-R29]|uniref:hypothetical protein n=1 Tax=Parendozoicomonas sp. Alg238-R29 TaxID=2993446 RepID=UPI00248DBEE1|nr:hypothetical protein [Parendozoicomonas sp. Alg238-R29]
MNGRKGSLPTLLALSVAAAIGSGSFAPASHSVTPLPSTYTASWECTAAMHQDWQCSSKPGQPYAENLEEIADKRSTLRGTFAHLMQQTFKNTQTTEVSQREKLIERIAHSSIAKKIMEQAPLTRSMADKDWVNRLSSRTSWPEDQDLLPGKREPRAQPALTSREVSEEEVSRSVLLSDWLNRARKRAAWPTDGKTDEPASNLVGSRSHIASGLAETKKEKSVFNKERRLYADDWLDKAGQRTSWAEAEQAKKTTNQEIEEAEEAVDGMVAANEQINEKGLPADEQTDSPNMKLISSITLQDDAAQMASGTALTSEEQQTGEITEPEPTPPRPMGFGDRLLAHQASSSSNYQGGIAPPVSVQSAQMGMPSFQMQMAQNQNLSSMQPSVPLPPQQPPQWLPNLEVTPSERLAKAYPKQNQNPRRYMPWQRSATPEQWKNAPSGTAMPSHSFNSSRPANTFVTPDDIPLPNGQPVQLPPSPQSETAQINTIGRSWSLSGQMIAQQAPQVMNPVPEPVIVHNTEDTNWPEPQYTASSRLAPELPSYAGKPVWPGAHSIPRTTPKADSNVIRRQPNNLRTYRRPPPVSPRDIYKLASAQEPTSAGPLQKSVPSPFHQPQQQKPKGPNSSDRLRESTREPAAAVEPKKAQPYKPQPSEPTNYLPGLQHASITPQVQRKASVNEMLHAPENSFSVQWLATTQPAQITRLKQHYPLLKDATVVRFLSNGQTWHILLSGIFPDIPSAMAYLRTEEFRDMTKRLNPWTRPLSGLKKLDLVRPNIANAPVAAAKPSSEQKALPQGQYTIQWMSAENPAVLKDLRNRFPQLTSAEVVMLNRSNKVQYLLIQGRFRSHQAVTDALQTPALSQLTRQMKPKARPMASLKHNTSIIRQPVFTQVSLPIDRQTSQILNAPDGSFTIQWLAAHKPKVLEKLKTKYPTLNTAETIHFRRNEKDWYVLVQGQYSSYRDAMNALNAPQFQELTGRLKPWTRKISGLRSAAGS